MDITLLFATNPLLLTALAAVAGALILGAAFGRAGRSTLLGGVLGAAAGTLGPQFFMLPLAYCPFDPENHLYTEVVVFEQVIPVNAVFLLVLLLFVVGTAAAIGLIQWVVSQLTRGESAVAGGMAQGMFRGRLTPWLLLLPSLVILLLFSYYPTLETFRLSTLLTRLGAPRSIPVCLDNFAGLFANGNYYIFSNGHLLFADSAYLRSFSVSFFMAFFIVIITLSLSLLIAVMAHMPIKGASVYRTLLVWPYAISPVVSGILFLFLFNPLTGIINHTLSLLGLAEVPWLLSPSIAPWAVIIASVWNIMGFNILFYIAGLQNVPRDLVEAAAIDGANAVQRFWRITVPMLSPITFFLIIINTTYAFFDTFGVIDYLTTGGPSNATSNLIYEIFVVGIQERDLGRAAAQSILLLVIVIALTIFQFRSSNRRVNYGA